MNRVFRTGIGIVITLGATCAARSQSLISVSGWKEPRPPALLLAQEPPLPPPAPRALHEAPLRTPRPFRHTPTAPPAPAIAPEGFPDGMPPLLPVPAVAPESPFTPEGEITPEPALAPMPPLPPEPPLSPEPALAPVFQEPADTPEPPEPPEAPELATLAFGLRAPIDAGTALFALQATPRPPRPPRSDEDDRYYERGQRDLERSRWDQAVEEFAEVAARGGAKADGALYWKAYALNKLGKREDALASLGELHTKYASSRWQDDAKALEIEVKQASGKPVNPDSAGDEELKLMALNGLMNSDPERATPLLEKLLHSSQSPKIKERALFVLAQSGSPTARKLVLQMAKGGSNPDLQMKAVNYLGIMGATHELGEVYGANNDTAVRRAVLHALMVSGAKDQLLAAAKGEKNPELRHVAINQLGVLGAHSELWQLYQVELTLEIKREIVNALFVGGAADKLLEVARTAKEPELRRDAISRLGNLDSHRTGEALASMYSSESDPSIRKQVIRALFVQGNGHAMVEIARKETDIDLKKEIVRCLSNMQSKEGTEYLLELLNK